MWRPAVQLKAVTDGICLRVILETSDPFLALLNQATIPRLRPSRTVWQQQIEGAWQILVRHDRMAAAALASVLTTLVPLDEPRTGDLVSATSGWAWGAIAMSLPADISLVAETLDHEFHHLILAAAEDLSPLVSQDDGRLYYAPWRDDPRPASALMQGTYAHFGVAGFWRRQRRTEPPGNHLRSEMKFVRAQHAALDAARMLADAGTLTASGKALTSGMLSRLESWRDEPVSAAAATAAAEIRSEHRLRWRLAHLHGDAQAIDSLARAWLAGELQTLTRPIPSYEVIPYTHRLRRDLFELLEMRYRDPLRFARVLNEEGFACPCDASLLKGEYAKARDGYVRLITSRGGRSAWVGLLLARQQAMGKLESSKDQPEIIADVYDRVLTLTGIPPDVDALIAWLSNLLAPPE